ncbi:MAG: chemotaxis protein CheA [Planctomycetota bacterium]
MVASIQTAQLEAARQRIEADGPGALDEVIAALQQLDGGAAAEDHADLARVCRVAADALGRIAGDDAAFARHAERVRQHLDLVLEYATAVVADAAHLPLVPPLLSLPDAQEEQHFRDTIAVFVGNALGAVAELEEEILSVESGAQPEDAVGAIRRIVHTLKAEFGVLQMAHAQRLCHDAETAIDACTERGQHFPVDVMLAVADWLQQYLDVLSRDVTAASPPATALVQRLRDLQTHGVGEDDRDAGGAAREHAEVRSDEVVVREVPPATAAATAALSPAPAPTPDSAPAPATGSVVLRVEGEFADSLNEFLGEARSHLSEAEGALLDLEQGDAAADAEAINRTFRAFHTIKGVAGFLGLAPIVELAHVAETVLDEARAGRLVLTQTAIDLLLQSGDFVNQMLSALEGAPAPAQAQFDHLVGRLAEATRGFGEATALAGPPTGAAGQVDVDADDDDAEAGDREVDADDAPPTAAAVLRPAVAAPAAAPRGGEESRAVKVERSVKVNTTRLDMLVDMVGELVIAQSMVLQHPSIAGIGDQALVRNIGQVGKITRDLQEAAMSLRMVTVKATFQKMARLVRDVAGKSGKRVHLTIQGEETELDRTVVEQISDPLVHMIRNAVDHGIEPVDVRRRAGKPDDGRLLLRAYHQGGSIVIEIKDDGRGIDKQRVVQKAIEKELLDPGTRAEDLPDQEAFGMIFMPGFSTAEKVTDLSGRGVGMDVVRRNIEALRGKIEIDSRLGAGTVFRMRLPLTLAIIDGMVLRVGRERYVLPTMSIEQSFLCAAADVHYLADRGECVHVRGEVLPVYRLSEVFGLADAAQELTRGILVTVEVDGQRCCLFVDEILGQQQVVIKSLGGNRVLGVSGGAIMSDGRVALILDLGAVVSAAVAV